MTFYPEGHAAEPPAPRLPPPGWLPDPSETGLERFWDGTRWTTRTRDRATRIENFVPASAAHNPRDWSTASPRDWSPTSPRDWSPTSPRDWTPASPRRSRVKPFVAFCALLVVGTLVAYQYFDRDRELPQESASGAAGEPAIEVPAPAADVPEPPVPDGPPAAPDVNYPVFGSTELVTFLEASMIAQHDVIDVTLWVEGQDLEHVSEALLEAGIQNPYLYVEGWEARQQGDQVEVWPSYIYDDVEAERRRSETYKAAAQGVMTSGAAQASSETEAVTLIHDFIVDHAVYDEGAFESIEAGETSPRIHQSQEAYGILVMGTAVCNGYSMAFSAMAEQVGLSAITVTGSDTAGATGGSHAWNKVLVDGRWLLVDTTWDDPIGGEDYVIHDYLLLEDGDPILDTRTISTDWVVDENLRAFDS